uniref:Late transcription factor 1 n=1 Tax=Talaromyces marneffei PM1 TaxID=1077442 RepID=A0A093V275_TALMA
MTVGLFLVLSGILLSPDEYWTFSDEKREEIHEAFEKAYKYVLSLLIHWYNLSNPTITHHIVISRDCVGHRIAPIDGALGTSLLWAKTQKKIYIFSFEICCEATVEDAWDSHVWLEWGYNSTLNEDDQTQLIETQVANLQHIGA